MPPTNEGPPDLDEILRKLQQKISGLLGFRGRSGGPPASGGGGGMGNVIIAVSAPWS